MHWAGSQPLLLGWGCCALSQEIPGAAAGTKPELMLCLLLPSAPHSLKTPVLGFEAKNCFISVLDLSAALLSHSEGSGIDHGAFEPCSKHRGGSFRSWVCVRTGRPKTPINRAHWLSASSVHSFPFWSDLWPYYAHWKNRCKFPGGY